MKNEFTPNYSYCEMQNSAIAINEISNKIMAKLCNKLQPALKQIANLLD